MPQGALMPCPPMSLVSAPKTLKVVLTVDRKVVGEPLWGALVNHRGEWVSQGWANLRGARETLTWKTGWLGLKVGERRTRLFTYLNKDNHHTHEADLFFLFLPLLERPRLDLISSSFKGCKVILALWEHVFGSNLNWGNERDNSANLSFVLGLYELL